MDKDEIDKTPFDDKSIVDKMIKEYLSISQVKYDIARNQDCKDNKYSLAASNPANNGIMCSQD